MIQKNTKNTCSVQTGCVYEKGLLNAYNTGSSSFLYKKKIDIHGA